MYEVECTIARPANVTDIRHLQGCAAADTHCLCLCLPARVHRYYIIMRGPFVLPPSVVLLAMSRLAQNPDLGKEMVAWIEVEDGGGLASGGTYSGKVKIIGNLILTVHCPLL
jgi:hypothetical protein